MYDLTYMITRFIEMPNRKTFGIRVYINKIFDAERDMLKFIIAFNKVISQYDKTNKSAIYGYIDYLRITKYGFSIEINLFKDYVWMCKCRNMGLILSGLFINLPVEICKESHLSSRIILGLTETELSSLGINKDDNDGDDDGEYELLYKKREESLYREIVETELKINEKYGRQNLINLLIDLNNYEKFCYKLSIL